MDDPTKTKTSSSSAQRPLAADSSAENPSAKRVAAAAASDQSPLPTPWTPVSLFLCGPLADPEYLQKVLGLSKTPILPKGKTSGFKLKLWGPFPSLVPWDGSEVEGVVYKVESASHQRRLHGYTTKVYSVVDCIIQLEDGSKIDDGKTFQWAGNPLGPELRDGSYDVTKFEEWSYQHRAHIDADIL